MDISQVWEELVRPEGGTIVYLILDGLGGIAAPDRGGTELQVAHTPHLDRLAQQASCGLLDIVGPGITPGSGPGHLALFGYDPLRYRIGRGILSALGIDFDLQAGDVAARVNFVTVDDYGRITDRRAGRMDTESNRRLRDKIREGVTLGFEGEYFFETVSEHRAVLILRGPDLGGKVRDTDPQTVGTEPAEPTAAAEDSQHTAQIVRSFVHQAADLLADEKPANMLVLRGFDRYQQYPSLKQRFGLHGVCVADYPMYRGVSRLLGMDVLPPPGGLEARFQALTDVYGNAYNFYFLHVKRTDSRGEDGDFAAKVQHIEAVDRLIPQVTALEPDVFVVTADHSTPAAMGAHSWHPVPVLLQARTARVDEVTRFDENACAAGALGLRPATHLMGLALAHAGRLAKFGA